MRARKIQGVVAVEFAILIIPLMAIVLLIIDFSTVMFNKAVVTNASREAVRAGILIRKSPSRLPDDEIKKIAQDICNKLLISYHNPTTAVVTVEPALAARQDFGKDVTVSVSYTFTGFILGGVSTLLGNMGEFKVASNTTMKNE